jgi:hypothetical protein
MKDESVLRQQSGLIIEDEFARHIDKCRPGTNHSIEPDIHEFVQQSFRSHGISIAKCRLRQLVVAAEQFICENLNPFTADGLPPNESFLHTLLLNSYRSEQQETLATDWRGLKA